VNGGPAGLADEGAQAQDLGMPAQDVGTRTRSEGTPTRDQGERPTRPTFSDRLPKPWLFPLLVFASVWSLILATWRASNAIYHTSMSWHQYFVYADGSFYLWIAQHGYVPAPHHLPPAGTPPAQAAFFPLWPALIRAFSYLTGHNFVVAGLIATIVSGAAAAPAVWALAARSRDRWLADRAVLLFCAFPGAMVLGLPYSEPLGVALTAFSLLAAVNRRWLLAGFLALLATAEHPTLIVLAGALGVVALHAIWTRREWRSLAAPVLAPMGMVGYFAWLGHRYRDYLFWPKLERRYWQQHIDWGHRVVHVLTWTFAPTAHRPYVNAMFVVMIVLVVVGVALMIAARLPLPVSAYTVLIVISLLISYGAGPKPRFAWTTIGIFIGAAAKLPRWLFWPVLVVSAGMLAFLVGYWPHHPVNPAPLQRPVTS